MRKKFSGRERAGPYTVAVKDAVVAQDEVRKEWKLLLESQWTGDEEL